MKKYVDIVKNMSYNAIINLTPLGNILERSDYENL